MSSVFQKNTDGTQRHAAERLKGICGDTQGHYSLGLDVRSLQTVNYAKLAQPGVLVPRSFVSVEQCALDCLPSVL